MTEIRELFYAYLDPNNPNPDESGKALLEQFCSSIDVLFEIIQNDSISNLTVFVLWIIYTIKE